MREAKVVGSNPDNGGKIHAKNRVTCELRHDHDGKNKIFLIFIRTKNIYFNMQKNDARSPTC